MTCRQKQPTRGVYAKQTTVLHALARTSRGKRLQTLNNVRHFNEAISVITEDRYSTIKSSHHKDTMMSNIDVLKFTISSGL